MSYGKDSLACLGAIKELGCKLDRIIHAEVWATDTIPAELPPMIEFKSKADEIIRSRYGLTVEHVSAGKSYNDYFYKIAGEGKSICANHIYGFPMVKGAWCNSSLKLSALKKCKVNGVTYLGIAYDEPKRFKVLSDTKISPLKELKWTESDCYKWCVDNDLLSPIYNSSIRGGCWFCHNQGVDQLRLLRKNYPDYWNMLLQWDNDSVITFKPDGHTVHDYDERFKLEDNGIIIPNDNCFRWAWLESDIQMKFFA